MRGPSARLASQSPLFLDAPPKLVGAICHCCTSTVVNDAETVYAARDLLPHLYLIVHGEARREGARRRSSPQCGMLRVCACVCDVTRSLSPLFGT